MAREDCLSGNKLFFTVWLLVPVLIFQIDYHIGNGHFTVCLFRNITGHNCYGCGVLRGIAACLHLDFKAAYYLNRLNLFTIPLLTFLYLKELWKSRPAYFRAARS